MNTTETPGATLASQPASAPTVGFVSLGCAKDAEDKPQRGA